MGGGFKFYAPLFLDVALICHSLIQLLLPTSPADAFPWAGHSRQVSMGGTFSPTLFQNKAAAQPRGKAHASVLHLLCADLVRGQENLYLFRMCVYTVRHKCMSRRAPSSSHLQQLPHILPNLRRASCALRIRQGDTAVVNDHC